MRILTVNAGSSSVKFSVFDMDAGIQLFKSQIERVVSLEKTIHTIPGILKSEGFSQFDAIGHRVAHGGARFQEACLIDDEVLKGIEACVDLAPLHNPPALAGIKVTQEVWPNLPKVAVFDTAFHQTIPERAYTYAVPAAWREAGLRRFGFHGTSHKYVMLRVAQELKTPASELRIISCHLGNGASVCAIDHGVSVDTSMGMTALEGLVMGTRSGDVDPGIFAYLQNTLGLTVEQIEHALYTGSGLAALSGIGNDMRDIERRAADGDRKAQLAIQVYAYRARKYIGAYAAAMGGVDVIAFTGGIGENSASMRKRIADNLGYLGLLFDDDANQGLHLTGSEAPQIQQPHSRVRVMVTQTREQWMIAQEVLQVVAGKRVENPSLPLIPVAVSAHHVHLTQETVERLFGAGYQLHERNALSQTGQWAAQETVDVIGPRGTLLNLRVLGPCRAANQIEIAETEAYMLGVEAPLRLSGDTANTPFVTLRGPKGSVQTNGLILAKRHIHTSPADAEKYGLRQGDVVEVAVKSDGRDLVFRDVVVRIDPSFVTEMHIDTDEANAAHIGHSSVGEVIYAPAPAHSAHVTRRQLPTDGSEHSYLLKGTSQAIM